MFNRASCTNSPFTPDAFRAAQALFEQLKRKKISFEDALERQRRAVSNIYDPSNRHGTGLIFAPSGSDLCYLPLLFSLLTKPDKDIINLVTCKEELGSGSLLAHQGLFFSGHSQISSRLPVRQRINSALNIKILAYSARDQDGRIIDPSRSIKEQINLHMKNASVVVSLVVGSKSGIEDSLSIIEEFQSEPVIWSVDLCQMRATPSLVRRLLKLNCLLFITGSKFYQAPAFCGGMLMPDSWIERLNAVKRQDLPGFDRLFTRHDLPHGLPGIRSCLPDMRNYGLLLRWQAALEEMSLFNRLPQHETQAIINNWNQTLVDELAIRSTYEPMGGQNATNRSIISFRLRGRNGYLSSERLEKNPQNPCHP